MNQPFENAVEVDYSLTAESPPACASLAVYCIAREEASQIEDWLMSVLRAEPSEVLIAVDSRSEDETLLKAEELASRFPCVKAIQFHLPDCLDEVERSEWDDMWERGMALPDLQGMEEEERRGHLYRLLHHFAGARNYALKHLASDWVLQVDCDERLTDEAPAILREMLRDTAADVDLWQIRMEVNDDFGGAMNRFYAERLLRRGARYRDAMHNWVDVPEKRRLYCGHLLMSHSRAQRTENGRALRASQRVINSEVYFKGRIDRSPKDHRALFYYASTLCESGKLKEAIPFWLEYLNCVPPCQERYQGAIIAARCAARTGEAELAQNILHSALRDNWRRAEAYLLLTDLASDRGDLQQAEHWCRIAMGLSDPEKDTMFVEVGAHTWMPAAKLNELYAKMGNWEAARVARQAAYRAGIPPDEAAHLRGSPDSDPMRLALFVDRGDDKFIAPLAAALTKGDEFDVAWYRDEGGPGQTPVTQGQGMLEDLQWCDAALFEWASPLLAQATKLPKVCRIAVRVHGYEVYSEFVKEVDWSKVDDVIFVAPYLANRLMRKCPTIEQHCRTFIVPGGVDTALFSLPPRGPSASRSASPHSRERVNFCLAGYLNSKKQIHWALILFSQALKVFPSARLHICGQWQDERVLKHCETLLRELGLGEWVTWYEWMERERLAQWYQDKDFFISCSYDESLHYSLAEAMACGVTPLVHCWESAREWYPDCCIWRTEEEFVSLLHKWGTADLPDAREHWRRWVVEHLSLDINSRRIARILRSPKVALCVGSPGKYGIEWKIASALRELGCVLVDIEDADFCLMTGAVKRPQTKARCLYWNAEQLQGDDELAAYRRREADEVRQTLLESDIYLQSQRDVYLGGWAPPFIRLWREKRRGVLFYGFMTPHRKEFIDALRERGIDVEYVEEYDHFRLNELINESKIVLNLHCNKEPNVETRLCEALGAGTLVVSERLTDDNPVAWLTDQIPQFEGVDDCARQLRALLHDDEGRERWARRLCHEVTVRLRLEHQVEKALERLGV